MTEEQSTEQQQTTDEQTTSEPVKSYSKEQYDGLKSNLVNQIGELKGQLDTFTKEREEQENAKLVENNQHKELLEKSQAQWQSERDELTKSIEQMKAEKTDLSLNNALISNGITDQVQIEGLKAIYGRLEDAPPFAEWLPAQNLAPKIDGKPSGSVGKVNPKGSDTLEQRLQSSDPRVKEKALMEQLTANMGIG